MSGNTIKGIELPQINSDIDAPIAEQGSDGSNTPIINDGIGWTVRGPGVHTQTGLVIFLDVLGMKGIWEKLRPLDVKNRLYLICLLSTSLTITSRSINFSCLTFPETRR